MPEKALLTSAATGPRVLKLVYRRGLTAMITSPEGAHMENLNRVVAELKSEQRRLERQLQEVKRAVEVLKRMGGRGPGRRTRDISAAGRARIAAAQRARWAKVRAGKRK